jgi:CheY-like chemotaxis protein
MRHVRRLDAVAGIHTAAVALTGFASQQDRDAAREAGFEHHLAKPVDPEVLIDMLRRLPKSDPPRSVARHA